MKRRSLLIAAVLLTGALTANAGFLDQEIVFSEAQIQAELDKRGPQEKRYGNFLTVSLSQPPRIRLGQTQGRASLRARIDLVWLGQPSLPVDVEATSGIRYDDTRKAFFLDKPVADSVRSAALPPEAEPMARQAISQLLNAYFKSQPIYVLREDGSPQEKAARWLLRAIRIEPGQVVATLSPV